MDTGEEAHPPIGSKIEEKIRRLELQNKKKMLEKVTEEMENHNGGIVSMYILGNNHAKSRETKTLDLNPVE